MLRLIEVASQSETFSKRGLENHESKIFAGMAQPGHYRGVFSIDRPPLLAVMFRRQGHGPNDDEIVDALARDSMSEWLAQPIQVQAHCTRRL